jgi:hypothetical protein
MLAVKEQRNEPNCSHVECRVVVASSTRVGAASMEGMIALLAALGRAGDTTRSIISSVSESGEACFNVGCFTKFAVLSKYLCSNFSLDVASCQGLAVSPIYGFV